MPTRTPSSPAPRFALAVRPSRIDGNGVFAEAPIPARRKIGEVAGEIISQREADRRARTLQRISIVEFGDGQALDASVGGNELRYVNHSCSGNAYIRIVAHRVELYARRDIARGEEITCDYGDTQHDGKLPCRCGSPNCRSAI